MYTPIIATRYKQNAKVVGFVIKNDPPCPPIKIYSVTGNVLHRILPNGDKIGLKPEGLELSIMRESIEDLRKKYPFMEVNDVNETFDPKKYLTNPLVEYDIF